MSGSSNSDQAKFGTVLGMASGGVAVYSSHYPSADEQELPNRHAYRSYVDGIFMGYKWQCVELARRWMYVNKGYIFDDVAMAYDIFMLSHVRRIADGGLLPMHSFRNGSQRHPEPGSLLIWAEGGEFEITGHVAVVTDVLPTAIRFVEQNVEDRVWPPGQSFSREIPADISADGGYWIRCNYGDPKLLGWVIQTDNARFAESRKQLASGQMNVRLHRIADRGQAKSCWLNTANPDEHAYVTVMKGHRLSDDSHDQYVYLTISETANKELRRATSELHALFMHATDYVLQDDARLEKFNLPRAIWPKLHMSWDNRRNEMITGRFDFTLSERGLKVYEYNADSASCHMESGKVQGKWAEHFGCRAGRNAGAGLHELLVDAWQAQNIEGVLHIMQDNHPEEVYHALFMKEALQQAGIHCKIITGVEGLCWGDDGAILDAEGTEIRWVWKTWAWETALDQIRAECEEDEERLKNYPLDRSHSGSPRLVDVLLRKGVMVYEPLWTLIPSNKAILPVLWQLFPNHPYLLNSSYALSPELSGKGYVSKPIAGRCGANITLVDHHNRLLEETEGSFGRQDNVYQEMFALPVLGGKYTQICTFSVAGSYAGACSRVDPSPVITADSNMLPLRIVETD